MNRGTTVLVVLMLCLAVAGCSTPVAPAPTAQGPTLDQVVAAARAFNSAPQQNWADGSVHFMRDNNARMQELMPKDKIYVSVGFAVDYPDQALVTVVRPSTREAIQYLFDPANPAPGLGMRRTDFDSLQEGLKGWNAVLDAKGNILIKGREADSMP
jgi:hypothetical protein